VIIGLAAIAALALTRRLTGPINRLSEMARGIEDGTPPKRSTHSGIPEIDTVADALNQSATRLGELVARERAFSANASHQLRTPLAALRLELESRELRGADMDEPLRQIDRLDDTIDTLLAAARDQQREREPFDVSSLLDEVRVAWAGPLADGGRAFVLAAPRDLHPARAARGAVREILWILVDNAVRHGDGTVRVQARSVDGSVAIDVADQGPGVADPSQIFARRSGSGRGIGLALARALAEADDARLDLVDATPGRTTFTLLLPAGTQPPGAA
jgi:signal transduction histidine kinase